MLTIFRSRAIKTTMIGVSRFSTFVFLDLETTGFSNPVEITELSMVAAEREHIVHSSTTTKDVPRLLDKFTVCVQPTKEIEPFASMVTGISNEDLQNRRKLDIELGRSVLAFLARQKPPVCLVAHNGDNFDFKVLISQLDTVGLSLPIDIRASDSLKAFRKHLREVLPAQKKTKGKRISCSLANLYSTFVSGEVERAHSAEGDALALLKLVIFKPQILECIESGAHELAEDKAYSSRFKQREHLQLNEQEMNDVQDEYLTQLEKEGLS